MSANIQELYESAISRLPARERLRLAALILNELARNAPALDASDIWSEQDERDLTAFALTYAAEQDTSDDERL